MVDNIAAEIHGVQRIFDPPKVGCTVAAMSAHARLGTGVS
jgi:hypothetical protein